MKCLLALVHRVDRFFQVVAGITLVLMLLMTIIDVTLRVLGRPFFGTIEIICFCGAMLIGFGVSYASWNHVHVNVDMFLVKLPRTSRIILQSITKCAGILFFTLIGYNFILYGLELIQTGEVSAALRMPYSPVMFALGFGCFLQSLTLLCDFPRMILGERQ